MGVSFLRSADGALRDSLSLSGPHFVDLSANSSCESCKSCRKDKEHIPLTPFQGGTCRMYRALLKSPCYTARAMLYSPRSIMRGCLFALCVVTPASHHARRLCGSHVAFRDDGNFASDARTRTLAEVRDGAHVKARAISEAFPHCPQLGTSRHGTRNSCFALAPITTPRDRISRHRRQQRRNQRAQQHRGGGVVRSTGKPKFARGNKMLTCGGEK